MKKINYVHLSVLLIGLFVLCVSLLVGGVITNTIMIYICILLPFLSLAFAVKGRKGSVKIAITILSGFIFIATLLLLYLIIFQTG